MKVLAIIGSLRKGNSYRITQQVENCLKSYSNNDDSGKVDLEFEYIFLNEDNLELCKGCFVCLPYGEDKCPTIFIIATATEQLTKRDFLQNNSFRW